MIHHRRTSSVQHGVEELTIRLSAGVWTAAEADYLLQVWSYVLERSHDMKMAVGSILCDCGDECPSTAATRPEQVHSGIKRNGIKPQGVYFIKVNIT